jgi:hypothetical protein
VKFGYAHKTGEWWDGELLQAIKILTEFMYVLNKYNVHIQIHGCNTFF